MPIYPIVDATILYKVFQLHNEMKHPQQFTMVKADENQACIYRNHAVSASRFLKVLIVLKRPPAAAPPEAMLYEQRMAQVTTHNLIVKSL